MRTAIWLMPLLIEPLFLTGGNLEQRYEKWLKEEVVYIISAPERSEFLKLRGNEEREAFLEKFWRIRDTDSSTQENEFRNEHYARIRYANERFAEGILGWKSERGRTWILHGAPQDIHYDYGGRSLGIDIENPTEVLTGDSNRDRRRSYRLTFNMPETEVWTYRRIEGARNSPSYFQVIFSKTDPIHIYELNQSLRHLASSSNLNYGERVRRDQAIMTFMRGHSFGGPYRIVYAGEYKFQDLDDFYQSVFHPNRLPSLSVTDFQAGLTDLQRPTGEVLMEKMALGRKLKEKVRSRVFFQEFPLSVRLGTQQPGSGSTILPVSLAWAETDTQTDPPAKGSDTLELLLELVAEDGSVAASVMDSVKVEPKRDLNQRKLLYQTRLSARPGKYRLQVYASFSGRGASAVRDYKVNLTDYTMQGFGQSGLVRPPAVALEQLEKSKQQFREAIATRLSFGKLPLGLSSRSFVQSKGKVLIHIQLSIPCSELAAVIPKGNPGPPSRIDVYGALVDATGGIADEFIDSLEISEPLLASQSVGKLHYFNSFAVSPGNYTVKAAVRNSQLERLGYEEGAVRLNPEAGDTLRMSDLLVTNHVQPIDSEVASSDSGSIDIGDARLLPNPLGRFTSSDFLFLYFQILLPKGKKFEECDFSVGASFIAGDSIVKRLEPRKILESNSRLPGIINFATAVRLEGFAPANYTVQVHAVDHVSNKFSVKRASFKVVPAR